MIDFVQAIKFNTIENMGYTQLHALSDLLTPKGTKNALALIKQELAAGHELYDLPIALLSKAVEITTNSVGFTHFSVNGTYYDIYCLCDAILEKGCYSPNELSHEIVKFLREYDFYSCDDEE